MNEKKKWNWNDPITWKQSIIWGGVGFIISVLGSIIWLYADSIEEKVNDIHHFICNRKKN